MVSMRYFIVFAALLSLALPFSGFAQCPQVSYSGEDSAISTTVTGDSISAQYTFTFSKALGVGNTHMLVLDAFGRPTESDTSTVNGKFESRFLIAYYWNPKSDTFLTYKNCAFGSCFDDLITKEYNIGFSRFVTSGFEDIIVLENFGNITPEYFLVLRPHYSPDSKITSIDSLCMTKLDDYISWKDALLSDNGLSTWDTDSNSFALLVCTENPLRTASSAAECRMPIVVGPTPTPVGGSGGVPTQFSKGLSDSIALSSKLQKAKKHNSRSFKKLGAILSGLLEIAQTESTFLGAENAIFKASKLATRGIKKVNLSVQSSHLLAKKITDLLKRYSL